MNSLAEILAEINFILSHQGSSKADTTWDPTFVAWNIVQCRPGTQIRLDLTEPNANGVVVAADIFLVEDNWKHTIFSFQNKETLERGFAVEIDNDYSVRLWRGPIGGSWENPLVTAAKLNLSNSYLFFI